MFQFKSTDTISYRVKTVVNAYLESRSEAWLCNLGIGECNDFAQLVTEQVSYVNGSKEHIRFETVARIIRRRKAALRIKLNQTA